MVTTAYIGTRDDEMLSNATELIEKAVHAYLDNAEAEKKEDKKSARRNRFQTACNNLPASDTVVRVCAPGVESELGKAGKLKKKEKKKTKHSADQVSPSF